jgi:hypothetical protein
MVVAVCRSSWLASLLVAGALAAPATAPAAKEAGRLVGVVGPGFAIAVDNSRGRLVTRLDPGSYRFTVHDRSSQLDFHLSGPGVNKRTSVLGTGTVHWVVTLRRGVYHYKCDAHATIVSGLFRVV